MPGSATTQAKARLRAELNRRRSFCVPSVASEVFAVAQTLSAQPQLRVVLGDSSAQAKVKVGLCREIFAQKLGSHTLDLLEAAVSQRWSNHLDLLEALEELGLRVLSLCAERPGQIEEEIFAVIRQLKACPQLELALSSRLFPASMKIQLAREIFGSSIQRFTLMILEHLLRHLRARRLPRQLCYAADIIADQSDMLVVEITVARPMGDRQRQDLALALRQRLGREVIMNEIVDSTVLGGVRVQWGDNVIDHTAKAQIDQIRLQLSGVR